MLDRPIVIIDTKSNQTAKVFELVAVVVLVLAPIMTDSGSRLTFFDHCRDTSGKSLYESVHHGEQSCVPSRDMLSIAPVNHQTNTNKQTNKQNR